MSRQRQTSLQAYAYLVDSGRLPFTKRVLYRHVFHHGPLTRNEIDQQLGGPGQPNPTFSRRISELIDQGLFCEAGVRDCKVSGRPCQTYDVTERVDPLGRKKKLTASQKLKIAVGVLREIIGEGGAAGEKARRAVEGELST